ncbi:MAG: hypothetical protein QNJ45_16070 [Ardenticatenaceae bacterium]|nr:hypothetical protein [Ardenticatenaceae bacterium]
MHQNKQMIEIKQDQAASQLFTLRVWSEEVDRGRFEIRGTLMHVLSGETHHFRDWTTLTWWIERLVKKNDNCSR